MQNISLTRLTPGSCRQWLRPYLRHAVNILLINVHRLWPVGVLLRCITGWGAHSARRIALIKPAVLDWAKVKGCKHFIEPGNDGVVIIHVTPDMGRYG
jgi:hypothetical protein